LGGCLNLNNELKVGFGLTQYFRGQSTHGNDGIGIYSDFLYHALSKDENIKLMPYSFGWQSQNESLKNEVNVVDKYGLHLIKSLINPFQNRFTSANWKPDIIHATDHLIPAVKGVPVLSTVMDAIPLSNPEWVGRKVFSSKAINFFVWKKTVKLADRIITCSHYSKNEISKYFDIDPSIINVIPLAVDKSFYEMIDPDVRTERLNYYQLINKQFYISIGTLQPRKNIIRVLKAMRLLPKELRHQYPLVIVGRLGWSYEQDEIEILQAVSEGWCVWLKRVTDFDVKVLLQSATALIFPSLSEGFGLPVLEAFASQTPVITSNTTSLPEVCGDAALLVNPESVEEISSALIKILSPEIANQLVIKGLIRSKQFSWGRTADETLKQYQSMT